MRWAYMKEVTDAKVKCRLSLSGGKVSAPCFWPCCGSGSVFGSLLDPDTYLEYGSGFTQVNIG